MYASLNEVQESRLKLQGSDKYYRLMVENLEHYAVFLVDPSGTVATWNKGAQQMHQYPSEEIIGRHVSLFYFPDAVGQQVPEKEMAEALRNGRWEGQAWRLRRDGSRFWASVVISPVSEDAHLLGFAFIIQDLTESKAAEDNLLRAYQDLKESEERYRLLIEGVTDYAIFMLNPQGQVVSWNEGARRLKGYEAHEITGKHFSIFYPQEARDSGYPDYELTQACKVGRFEDEGWRLRQDGSRFWANVIITAIFNPQGELLGFSKITRDLTERKQLEEQLYRTNEELKNNEERTRLLIDSVKDYAILMLDPTGKIISWNVGAERIKGYHASEIIGQHFSVFYTPEANASGFPQYELNTALKRGRFEDEGWRLRKDGSAFWANVVITAIFDSAHRHLGFAKVTRDLTERKKNEELMRKNQELLRLNRELDSFVYTASHDLKAPIANLEGLLSELRQDLGPEQQTHAGLLSWIDDTLLSLKKVVGDLAEVTRIDQDEHQMELIALDLLLGEVKDSLREQILHRQASIVADFSAVPVLAYSRKNLRSILFNLVSNAVKYADPAKKAEVKVTTEYLPDEKAVLLTVADNGLGLPENQKEKIFTMFRRFHTHVEGSGVGLYLVKKILENQGDRITVESEQHIGSTFRVFFYQQRG